MHQNILNLRGSGCAEFLQSLSEQFKPFGVLFTQAKITDVRLPPDIADALKRYTTIADEMKTASEVY